MTNCKMIMANSAMPYKIKKTCLIQEVVQILRNTSRDIDDPVKNQQLTEFSLRMKESGYHEKMRREVIRRGIETYEKQVEREVNGICPL